VASEGADGATSANVDAFIDEVPNQHRRSDGRELGELMRLLAASTTVLADDSRI
jgi:hypothetical protein